MQTLIDSTGPFKLPTHWGEVTTAQFCATDPLTTMEQRASYFAGRPIQVNALVSVALAWMMVPPPTNEGGLPYPADLGQETYLQVETIRALLTARPLHECLLHVWAVFIARKWNFFAPNEYRQDIAERIQQMNADSPITQVYPAVIHCLAELERLATKYAELAEPDPTEAARRAREAGADELMGMFSHYNVARAVAQQMGITLDAAYALPWETVAVHLLHDRRTAILTDTIQRNSSKAHD